VVYEVARVLNAPLDVILVRKIGMPGQPELAIGAIASENIVVHEPRIAKEIPDLATTFDRLVEDQRRELERRERVYRPGVAPLETPAMLFAIGEWYQHFEQLEEPEVCCLIDLCRRTRKGPTVRQDERRETG
jgi:predicted phosphoribosyltransferase